ncbi:hypothetical protein [Cardiobacterium sp. Marseille-Q4385]|uniref:hypothetical protein n=1 Tax=Cardiobacterium sp. Marseille-Q4385 TaxID=2866573 RepID=UPI001CE3DEDC|nr:hypothetical protein [Cardiobacterium sp. Marseille-Q4385]
MFLLVIIEGFNGGGIMHALAAAFGESCAILLILSATSAENPRMHRCLLTPLLHFTTGIVMGLSTHQKRR